MKLSNLLKASILILKNKKTSLHPTRSKFPVLQNPSRTQCIRPFVSASLPPFPNLPSKFKMSTAVEHKMTAPNSFTQNGHPFSTKASAKDVTQANEYSRNFYNKIHNEDNPISIEKLQAMYINGQWVTTDETYPVYDPVTEKAIAYMPCADMNHTKQAIEAAYEAFQTYSQLNVKERHDILIRWANLIKQYTDELVQILTLENGKPKNDALGEITTTANTVEWYAEQVRAIDGAIIPASKTRRFYTFHQPVGVCSIIVPWNVPAAMIVRKVGAAFAVGCTAVVKAAAETPLIAMAIAKLGEMAGLPKGVMNVLSVGDNLYEIGKEMCTHPHVKKISFTGSCGVGKTLMNHAASTVKKLSLELGGNAPFIIMDDCDINHATDCLITCKFRNTGQTCISANRILVQENIFDMFTNNLIQKMQKMNMGAGYEPDVTLGPLVSPKAVSKCESLVSQAISVGAKVMFEGNERWKQNKPKMGYFYPATVLDCRGIDISSPGTLDIFYKEIFGPVVPMYSFKTSDEAIKMANSVDEGLASYVMTNSINKFVEMPEKLNFGMVGVNEGLISFPEIPFGGVKESGIGREGARVGLEEYMETKYVALGGQYK